VRDLVSPLESRAVSFSFAPHPRPLSEGEGWLAHQVESRIKKRKIREDKSQRELSAAVPSPSERVRVRCFCKEFDENETALLSREEGWF
jgi:hypothetical protein